MKLDINDAEKQIINEGLAKALASAKRQQAATSQPQLREIFLKMERDIVALQIKVGDAK